MDAVLTTENAMPTTLGQVLTVDNPEEYRALVDKLFDAGREIHRCTSQLVEDEVLTPIQAYGATFGAIQALFGFSPKYESVVARLPGTSG